MTNNPPYEDLRAGVLIIFPHVFGVYDSLEFGKFSGNMDRGDMGIVLAPSRDQMVRVFTRLGPVWIVRTNTTRLKVTL